MEGSKIKKACPVSTDIPTVMDLFLEGNEADACKLMFENNSLSALCSVVCPHKNNCFGNCVLINLISVSRITDDGLIAVNVLSGPKTAY